MYNTRYYFMKKIYPNYFLLFKTSKNKLGYKAFGYDKYILDGIRNYTIDINIIIKRLNKLNISYIIVDNLEIKKINNFQNNMYVQNLYKFMCLDIMCRIRSCVLR